MTDAVKAEVEIDLAQLSVRLRVPRVQPHRLGEEADTFLQVGRRQLVPKMAPLQAGLEGLRMDLVRLRGRRPRLRVDDVANLTRDVLGDVRLESQDIAQLALVSARPQMFVLGHVNQLCRHADPLIRARDGALDDAVHAQLLRDLRQGLARPLERHDRRP